MLENVEKIVANDRRFFYQDLLSQLLSKCPQLQIMASTCELMTNDFIPDNIQYSVIFVQELDPISSVELFLTNTGIQECSAEEVHALAEKYPEFDWSRVLPDSSEDE